MPLGTTVVVGTNAIYNAFAGLFKEVNFIQEYILGEPKINGNYAGLAKMFYSQVGNCDINLEVICMYTFDENASITAFSAIWNVTDFEAQASC